MRRYVAALGSLFVGAVVLVSIFVIEPALTDDDGPSDPSTTTLPGVSLTTASTNEHGSAFFDGEDGEEIEVRVHHADGTTWDNVSVHYLDGDTYELFIAEDPLGRFLPSWTFTTQTSLVDLTTRVDGLVEVEPETDQFNAMVAWIDDVKTGTDVRHCITWQQFADESDTRVALTSATLSPPSSLWAGVGTARTTIRFLVDILSAPAEALFDVYEFALEGITTTIRHYEPLNGGACQPEVADGDAPVPTETPSPGQPSVTPLPERPTPDSDEPTDTPGPRPLETPRPQPTNSPGPTPTEPPVVVEEDFMRIIAIEPSLGTRITEHTTVSVTVEFRVSSVVGVSISGLADVDANLLSLGIYTLPNSQGMLKLQGKQFNSSEARLCAVSVTMERLTRDIRGGEQIASDSRGYVTPVC